MILKGTLPLESKRLRLRRLTIRDYEEAFEKIYSSVNIAKKISANRHISPYETKQLFENYEREYINLYTYRWIIELKDTKELVGIIELKPTKYSENDVYEIGYCISEDNWNKGYATESLKEVIKFLFEIIEINVISAELLDNNYASARVLEKVNMKYEGILRNRIIDRNGNKRNLKIYSISKEEYLKNK